MNVLLINAATNYVMEKYPVPLGLLSIATYLDCNGHGTHIYDRAVDGTSVKKVARTFLPDIVGISLLSTKGITDAMRLSKHFNRKKVPVVWGGPAASLIPELILKSGVVDYVVVGDGEKPLLALIEALKKNDSVDCIHGLALRHQGELRVNERDYHADLSDLPALKWNLIDTQRYILLNVYRQRMLHTFTSWGCIGSCGYCYNPSFSKGVWRPRSFDNVLQEIRELVTNHQIDAVTFVDDLLSPDEETLHMLCKRIKSEGTGVLWGCDIRVDIVSRKELEAMYDAGCRWIFFGIESGSPEMQKQINKNLDLDKAKETLEICREIGICTTTSFIVGFPHETKDDLKQTIQYANSICSDVKVAFSFGPIPNTLLHRRLVEEKKLKACTEYTDIGNYRWFDTFGKNYSSVPTRDCKVITSCFYYLLLTSRFEFDGKKKSCWIERFLLQVSDMWKMGSLRAIKLLFLSTTELLRILFYASMFPRIRKEYGLDILRKPRKND